MKLIRPAFAAVLSSTLVLSACTGDDGTQPTTSTTSGATGATTPGSDSSDASGSTAGTAGGSDGTDQTGATSSAGGDQTGATSSTGGDQTGATSTATGTAGSTSTSTDTVTAAPAGVGVVSIDEAQKIADRVLKDAAASQVADRSKAMKLIDATFRGPEVGANRATVLLRGVVHQSADYAYHPEVLAISREGSGSEKYILAQTVPESGLPELHLISQRGKDWYIVWTAPMLAGTKLGTFDRRSEGSKVLSTRGDLAVAPGKALRALAGYTTFPRPEKLIPLRTNGYVPEVRAQAQAQADSVAEQARFTQDHTLIDHSVRTLQMQDGSAMVFGVMDRRSTFKVRSGMELAPPASFRVFVDDGSITNRAQMRSYVFVAMHVPAGKGSPELIAAREQLVGASGS